MENMHRPRTFALALERLRRVGLRPTRQRLALAKLLMTEARPRKDVFEVLTGKKEAWAVEERNQVKEMLAGRRRWTLEPQYYECTPGR